ncbi:hypothetical protein [Psychrobacter sp. Pi2-51]|uniref:hypothetical protein n=1 Tax=Psychrobacter sp. Pi2-51 TaxID=2774132 RepID=UPI00191AF058|nr:hypothetical protein [Psychrobacter sp. Pi2-51]
MLIPKVEFLDDIQATDAYQKQLNALYLKVYDKQYQQLTVLIDLNAHGTAVLDILDGGANLLFERVKRIHHTFEDDLALIDIQLNSSTGQRLLEQLLALAIYENSNDIAGHAHPRSVCLWLFDQPITERFKHSIYLIGQAYGLGSNKRRYLRYWDPRVLALLTHIWTAEQKLQVYQLKLPRMHYVDWNNTFKEIMFPLPNKVYPSDTKAALEQLKPLPFRFSQQQWQLLEQTEWINMIVRQLKEQVRVTEDIVNIVISQALLIAKRQVTQQQAVNNVVKSLVQMSDDRSRV